MQLIGQAAVHARGLGRQSTGISTGGERGPGDGRGQLLYEYLAAQLTAQLEVECEPSASIDQVVAAYLALTSIGVFTS